MNFTSQKKWILLVTERFSEVLKQRRILSLTFQKGNKKNKNKKQCFNICVKERVAAVGFAKITTLLKVNSATEAFQGLFFKNSYLEEISWTTTFENVQKNIP